MLRFISIIAFLVIFFTLTLPIVFLILLIGIFNRHLRDVIAFKMVRWGFRVCIKIAGTTLNISGKENIPTDQASLFIGNHLGFFDVVSGYAIADNLTGFIAKKEFIKIPGLNWWMHLVNCLFLDRNDPRQGMRIIQKSIELVKSGVSIFVFPEGTRSRDGKVHEFKEGTFRIATKTKCPIIPVAFMGSAEAFENHFPKVKPCTITIVFGKPIYCDDYSKAEQRQMGSHVREKIINMLEEISVNH